jgi:nicotinamidase-related amidase
MQRLFAEPTDWFLPWLPRVLPNVIANAQRHPDRTLVTRFMPPQRPEDAVGVWRDCYRHWRAMTRERLDPELLQLVEPLHALMPPAKVLDKTVYSAFSHPKLAGALRHNGVETLIGTGGETDVCVAATVMAAIDLGFHIVLPTDALCGASDATHDA